MEKHAARIVRNIIIGIELANCSARNPLIVRADICGFSAWSSAEKVKFSVSCTVIHYYCMFIFQLCNLYMALHSNTSLIGSHVGVVLVRL